jgi:hypothetical protein
VLNMFGVASKCGPEEKEGFKLCNITNAERARGQKEEKAKRKAGSCFAGRSIRFSHAYVRIFRLFRWPSNHKIRSNVAMSILRSPTRPDRRAWQTCTYMHICS